MTENWLRFSNNGIALCSLTGLQALAVDPWNRLGRRRYKEQQVAEDWNRSSWYCATAAAVRTGFRMGGWIPGVSKLSARATTAHSHSNTPRSLANCGVLTKRRWWRGPSTLFKIQRFHDHMRLLVLNRDQILLREQLSAANRAGGRSRQRALCIQHFRVRSVEQQLFLPRENQLKYLIIFETSIHNK